MVILEDKKYGVSIFPAIIPLFFGILILVLGLLGTLNEIKSAKDYESVIGTVTDVDHSQKRGKIKLHRSNSSDDSGTTVEYIVNDISYTLTTNFTSIAIVQGDQLKIKYNPYNPEEALVLGKGISGFFNFFGLFALFVGLIFLFNVSSMAPNKSDKFILPILSVFFLLMPFFVSYTLLPYMGNMTVGDIIKKLNIAILIFLFSLFLGIILLVKIFKPKKDNYKLLTLVHSEITSSTQAVYLFEAVDKRSFSLNKYAYISQYEVPKLKEGNLYYINTGFFPFVTPSYNSYSVMRTINENDIIPENEFQG